MSTSKKGKDIYLVELGIYQNYLTSTPDFYLPNLCKLNLSENLLSSILYTLYLQ